MTTLSKSPGIVRPAPLRAPARIVANTPETFATFDSEMRMIPGVHVSLRSMYATVEHGSHGLLISPLATAEEQMVVAQRSVTLIAPSLLHHKFLPDAIARYHPDTVWGPEGLQAKRPELGGVRVFGRDAWPYARDLDFVVVEGADTRKEVVFFHRATKTIYTADLVFNIHEPKGLLAPIAFRAMGVYKRFAMAKMWKSWVKDKAAFQRSIDAVLAWDFERIVMAHGEIVTQGGPALLERAMQELGLYA